MLYRVVVNVYAVYVDAVVVAAATIIITIALHIALQAAAIAASGALEIYSTIF